MTRMRKAKLLEKIGASYGLFKATLAELSEVQMTEPGVIGEWSVKDILAHILLHQRRMLGWVKERVQGHLPDEPQPYDRPEAEVAELNERFYLAYRDWALSEVLHELDRVHADVLAFVAETAEANLIDPELYALEGGEALWEAVAANTCDHYEEHGQDIRKWLAASPELQVERRNAKE